MKKRKNTVKNKEDNYEFISRNVFGLSKEAKKIKGIVSVRFV